jgi:hypothetical protein
MHIMYPNPQLCKDNQLPKTFRGAGSKNAGEGAKKTLRTLLFAIVWKVREHQETVICCFTSQSSHKAKRGWAKTAVWVESPSYTHAQIPVRKKMVGKPYRVQTPPYSRRPNITFVRQSENIFWKKEKEKWRGKQVRGRGRDWLQMNTLWCKTKPQVWTTSIEMLRASDCGMQTHKPSFLRSLVSYL